MDKQVAKLMKELCKDPMYELYDDEKLAAFAEEIKQEISDYEASGRKILSRQSSVLSGWNSRKASTGRASRKSSRGCLIRSPRARARSFKCFIRKKKVL